MHYKYDHLTDDKLMNVSREKRIFPSTRSFCNEGLLVSRRFFIASSPEFHLSSFIPSFALMRSKNPVHKRPIIFEVWQGLASAFATDLDILGEWLERRYLGVQKNE